MSGNTRVSNDDHGFQQALGQHIGRGANVTSEGRAIAHHA